MVSEVFWLFFAPSHFLGLTIVASAILLNTKFDRIGPGAAIAAVILFVIFGILPLGSLLIQPLENRFTRPNLPARVDGVLVLGGGLNTRILDARGAPPTEFSEGRLVSAYELARRYPNARIVFSGGSDESRGGVFPEAEGAKYIFEQMGLDPRRLTLEGKSSNTWENFVFSRKLVNPRPDETWILATSAVNMPRAMEIAERQNWKMIPWPTDYQTLPKPWIWHKDVWKNLWLVDTAVHEWVGLLAYR
jgi:uncharacterized SAM-binding protein YcdF (DUF218 family)